MTKISILIPTYNEQAAILTLLRKVADQNIEGIEFEILVIDDGSTDDTLELLEGNPELFDRLIKLTKNGGKGAAVLAGLRHATGDFILFQDADLEYEPNDYAKLLEPVTRFDADVVLGSRLVAPPITRVFYFWHRVGNQFITFLFNLMNNTTFTDIYSCYLLYRRNLVDPSSLRTRGWQQHAEILSIASSTAKRVFEVPISYYGRTFEEGKKIRARHVFGVIWTIIIMRLFRRR